MTSDEETFKTCRICNGSMRDPRILNCSHSFCLKCLELSNANSQKSGKCPVCQIEFSIPQSGLKDLKKNRFLQSLDRLCENSQLKCDWCREKTAVQFCLECSINYCTSCLASHDRLPVNSTHQLRATGEEEAVARTKSKYSVCAEHSEIVNLFCRDCNLCLCVCCLAQNHKTHNFNPLNEHLEHVKNALEQKLKEGSEKLECEFYFYQKIEKLLKTNEWQADYLKHKVEKRCNELKNVLDSIVEELREEIDKQLEVHQMDSRTLMTNLKYDLANLNDHLEMLHNRLDKLCFDNIRDDIQDSVREVVSEKRKSEKLNRFKIDLVYINDRDRKTLKRLLGDLKIKPGFELL